jgi:hypothetical protein
MSEAQLLQSSNQMQQTLAQKHTLKEDKEISIQEDRQLKTTLVELRSQLEGPFPPQHPSGRTEAEQQLEEEAQLLRKEMKYLAGQLQTEVQENDRLNCLNWEQALALEQTARIPGEQVEDDKEDVKNTENDHTRSLQKTLRDPNLVLKEQLAQLQDDNMKVTIILQSEPYVKVLAKKLGQLQESLQLKVQEVLSVQEQGDQCLSYQHQDVVTY